MITLYWSFKIYTGPVHHCITALTSIVVNNSSVTVMDNELSVSYKEYKGYKEYKFKILSYKRNCQDNKNIIPLIKCYFGFISCTFKS